jgi:hypothetical protein
VICSRRRRSRRSRRSAPTEGPRRRPFGCDPYRYVEIQGRAEPREQGAEEHIDALARKYIGQDRYPWRAPGDVRVTYVVKPERLVGP